MINVLEINDYNIYSVTDNSDTRRERTVIKFNNGYSLSIIRGQNTDGGWIGAFEIAIIDPKGNFRPDLLGDGRDNDTRGWLYEEDILNYVRAVGEL